MKIDEYLKQNESIDLKQHPEVKEALEQFIEALKGNYN